MVRQILDWCINGLGKESIVRRLNKQEIDSFKHGDGWNASVVGTLLVVICPHRVDRVVC
ncbi:MAG: hypothetical protein ACSLE1_00660 [Sphingobium sp.]